MITNLIKIADNYPCKPGWTKLLAYLNKSVPDDEPLAITTILDSNGLDDAIWSLCAVDGKDREIRLYGVWCAAQVSHLVKDPEIFAALRIAALFAEGNATEYQLNRAKSAAWMAARSLQRSSKSLAEVSATWAAAWTVVNHPWAAASGASSRACEIPDTRQAVEKAQEQGLRAICA